jgi:hypothetical protein
MTQLNFGRDVQGMNAYAPMLSDTMVSAGITAGAATGYTVPSKYKNYIAIFSYPSGSDVWVSVNNTAAAPAGDTFSSTSSFGAPTQLSVKENDVISCFNNGAETANVGIALYAVS